jgi:transposase
LLGMDEASPTLFGQPQSQSNQSNHGPASAPAAETRLIDGSARLLRPDRFQVVFEPICLDELVPAEHRVRQIWAFVLKMDTKALEDRVGSRLGDVGAPAIEPRLLLALWLYAYMNGIGSARELDRLCKEHNAYRWLCGRVGVNYHSLSDFRVQTGEFLDNMLTEMIAAMIKVGVVDGSEINQDGTKVRAAAGISSFRREEKMETLKETARAHIEQVKAQADDPTLSVRVKAARDRAANERAERVDAALEALKELKETKERNKAKRGNHDKAKAEPRASTTDAQARQMRMSDGGTRPAYNVQLGTDAGSRAIIGLIVTAQGNDQGLTEAMRKHVEGRTGVKVGTHVADAGYISKDVIEREEQAGVACVIPLPINKKGEVSTSQPSDGPGVTAWRQRMQTDEAKAKMKQRGGIAETPNAELKIQRGMDRMVVRGLEKVKAVMLLGAILYNVMHFAEVWIGQPLVPR